MEDLQSFASELYENIKEEAQYTGQTEEKVFTDLVLEYIALDEGIYGANYCHFAGKALGENFKISAFDYDVDSGVMDLIISYFNDKNPETSIPNISNREIERQLNLIIRFFNATINKKNGKFETQYKDIPMNSDIQEVIETIQNEYNDNNIKNIRIHVFTNCYNKDSYNLDDNLSTEKEIPTEYQIWDIDAIYKIEGAGRTDCIDIDMADYDYELDCLPQYNPEDKINAYLAILPASILAQIYDKHKQRLLDQNVRTYLGAKIKVNKHISQTIVGCNEKGKELKPEPYMFFSYNNGLSSIAKKVEVIRDENGRLSISKIIGWQIVNGGQTSSTIYNVYKNNKKDVSVLSNVYLTLKITEVDDDKQHLVPKIAQSANSQTAIRDSDLTANCQPLMDLSRIASNEWTSANGSKPRTIWFFERMRGQRLTELNQSGTPRSNSRKKYEMEHPKHQVFNKADLAKWEMAWNQSPDLSAKGGETCYDKYYKIYLKNNIEVTPEYFKKLIAKAIIYKKSEEICKELNYSYRNIISCYVLAILALKSNYKLNLIDIWEKQETPEMLNPIIKECVNIVATYIRALSENPSINVQSEAKKAEFWKQLSLRATNIEFDSSLLDRQESALTEQQLQTIEYVKSYNYTTWHQIGLNGKDYKLSLLERKTALNVSLLLQNNRDISIVLAERAKSAIDKAIQNGYIVNN